MVDEYVRRDGYDEGKDPELNKECRGSSGSELDMIQMEKKCPDNEGIAQGVEESEKDYGKVGLGQ